MLVVRGASWGRGWGWPTEEGSGTEDFPLQAWLTMVDLEEAGKERVLGQAGRSCWAEKAGRARSSTVQALGVQHFWLASGRRWVVGSCLGQLLVAAANRLDSVMDLEEERNTSMKKSVRTRSQSHTRVTVVSNKTP